MGEAESIIFLTAPVTLPGGGREHGPDSAVKKSSYMWPALQEKQYCFITEMKASGTQWASGRQPD